jgi:hypothetical protein
MLKKRLINKQHVLHRTHGRFISNAPDMYVRISAFSQAIIRHVDAKIISISVCPPLDDFCIDVPDRRPKLVTYV